MTEDGGAPPTSGSADGGSAGDPHMGGEPSTGGRGGAGCENSLPTISTAPATLEETGFYSDSGAKTVAPELREFAPKYQLWSDGALKTRWLYLPECGGVIDTSAMDAWLFPVGTYSFKRFEVDGKLVETRMIHKYGPASDEVLYATYVWDQESQLSHLDDSGHVVPRDGGADYEVPSVAAGHCARCHGSSEANVSTGGLASRLLGLNAVDLSHEGPGLTLDELISEGALSAPPVGAFTPPGDAIQEAALGYLHANCGYCHNDTSLGQPVGTDYFLRLRTTDTTLDETGLYSTAVNVPVSGYSSLETEPCSHRIYGGDVGLSCIYERMSLRPVNRMPPLDTNRPDEAGLSVIEAFIESLSPAN